ncbi:MAG: VOC family protein [Pseudomonadota bacterium]
MSTHQSERSHALFMGTTNQFVWVDLSTFDLSAAKAFYAHCFGWAYHEADDGYEVCLANRVAVAGLYTMPEVFQKMGMPSFWMSYVQVADLDLTVSRAEALGAKIEIRPQAGPGDSRIALIRDPAGAGFTCLEGDWGVARSDKNGADRPAWHELHVSDVELVKNFYEGVFGWRIVAGEGADRYEIFHPDSPSAIAGIQVSPNEVKGDKEYWGVYIAVDDLAHASAQIANAGGEVVTEQPLGDRPALLAYDPQGAAFYLVQAQTATRSRDTAGAQGAPKWRAMVGLGVVVAAVLLDISWFWGVLFLLWVVPDLKSGVTHFLERVDRRTNPTLYWLIMATWLCLSLFVLLEPMWLR